MSAGPPVVVQAMTYGPFAIHKALRGSGWGLVYTPMAGGVRDPAYKIVTRPTLKDATALLEAILQEMPELAHARTLSDIESHSRAMRDILNNPPQVSKAVRVTPLLETRAKVRGWLVDAGLRPMGERYGKAGEFFGVYGGKGSRVISLGARDLLLNEYIIQKSQHRTQFDERWNAADSELLSKVSPELVAKWVNWVEAGPSKIDLRNSVREKGGGYRSAQLTTGDHMRLPIEIHAYEQDRMSPDGEDEYRPKYARFAEGDTKGWEKWMKTQPQSVQDDWDANKEKYGDKFTDKKASRHR